MNKKLLVIIMALILPLLGSSLGATAGQLSQTPGKQKGLPQQGSSQMKIESSPLTPVGSGFTYQGRLVASGSPASGNYDFTFTLFDAATGGNQIGNTITALNQTLSIGTFTTVLDFGSSVFRGDARWLQIGVRPSGGPSFTILSPRQALTPAPYAMGLKPGTEIDGATNSALFSARNDGIGSGVSGVSGTGIGLYGVGISSGTGVEGDSGLGPGVLGTSNSGYAMDAEGDGHAKQARTGGGWAKALLRVGGGAVTRCYNSQGATPNTNPPCTFVIQGSGGDYTITFNFQVSDRFAVVTPEFAANQAVIPTISYPATNQIRIRTWSGGTTLIDSAFTLIIY